MITQIEAKNYRCLKSVSQTLNPFQILVGPNASGKTTFLDVVNFLSNVTADGIDKAIYSRAKTYPDLSFGNNGEDIELAIEARIPTQIISKMNGHGLFDSIRYELKFGVEESTGAHLIKSEKVWRFKSKEKRVVAQQRLSFPEESPFLIPFDKVFNAQKGAFKISLSKKEDGTATFYPETGSKWHPSFKIGLKKSALANMPEDETLFPASVWLKDFLLNEVQLFILNSQKIREESPTGQGFRFIPDGSNLPWVLDYLKKNFHNQYLHWLEHIQIGLPDIASIDIVEVPSNKYKYLKIKYQNGIETPSWTASDGTLRFLALTIVAYLPDFKGIFLIEEPENGIHPKIMESVYQSLRSVYDAQILVATHSPVFLSIANPADILCFAKNENGATDIVRGNEHPKLKNWMGETNFSSLFASGILG